MTYKTIRAVVQEEVWADLRKKAIDKRQRVAEFAGELIKVGLQKTKEKEKIY